MDTQPKPSRWPRILTTLLAVSATRMVIHHNFPVQRQEEPIAVSTPAPSALAIQVKLASDDEIRKMTASERNCKVFSTLDSFKKTVLQTRAFTSTMFYLCTGNEQLRIDGIENFQKWFQISPGCANTLMDVEMQLVSTPSKKSPVENMCGLIKADPKYAQRVTDELNNNPNPNWDLPD